MWYRYKDKLPENGRRILLAYRQYYRYKARSMPSFTYTNATKPEWMT